jgi:hypothetical protein
VDTALVHRLSDLGHQHGAAAIDLWIDWLQQVEAELAAGDAHRDSAATDINITDDGRRRR